MMILAIVTALAMMLTVATPASAASGLCWPSGGPQAARMSISTWDSSYSSNGVWIVRKTYHIDLNSSGSYWIKNRIGFRPYYGGSMSYYSNVEDVYLYQYNSLGTQRVEGRWRHYSDLGEGTYSWAYCYITI